MRRHSGFTADIATRTLLTSALLLTSGLANAETRWQTTRFQVYMGVPFASDNAAINELYEGVTSLGINTDRPLDLPQYAKNAVPEMEDLLHKIAKELESLKFTDPVKAKQLGPVVETPNGPAVRVYLTDRDEDSIHYTPLPPCNDPNRHTEVGMIQMPLSKMFKDGKLSDIGYQSLAHELFHAVQHASPFFNHDPRNCRDDRDWILEGTADAVSFDLIRKLTGASFASLNYVPQFAKLYGARHYSPPLIDPDGPADLQTYATSSFWRFLAEVTANQDGVWTGTPDYRYLARLFKRPLSAGSIREQMQWLSAGLGSQRQLDYYYPQFVTAISQHIHTRVSPDLRSRENGPIIPADQRESKWLSFIFGGCYPLVFGNSKLTDRTSNPVEVKAYAARCLKVVWAGKQPMRASLVVRAEGAIRNIDDVHLSLIGRLSSGNCGPVDFLPGNSNRPKYGCLLTGSLKDGDKSGPKYWRSGALQLYGGSNQEYYLILSNAAAKPGESRAGNINVSASLESWTLK